MPIKLFIIAFCVAFVAAAGGCRSSGTGGGGLLGTGDETAAAGEVVQEANAELQKIKVLYKENENKREEIRKALEADDAETVRKLSNEVVLLINEGTEYGETAVEKIQKAQEMQINDEYREYLRLKEDSLKRQLAAFEEYRKAAQVLRNNYDPKNSAQRDKVKAEFTQRSENYRKTMEEARDYSNRANELRKEVLQRQGA